MQKKNSQQSIPQNSGPLPPSGANQSQPRPPSNYQPSTAQQLTTEGENWNGSFSPDGRKIIFLSEKRIGHSQSQVYELNLSLSRQRRVTFHDGDDASPHFDSSGRYILYSSTTDEIKEDPVFIQKSLSELSSPPPPRPWRRIRLLAPLFLCLMLPLKSIEVQILEIRSSV
ncbi:MAG: PD40 domain-containing protein [Bdellovibrionales bacterium]|nr:PD40 domain-containing protein [Bdellovibrionales bacterium]